MKKALNTFLISSLALFLFAGCSSSQTPPAVTNDTFIPETETLSVYTSFYPMYDFTSKIAGDKAIVINMVPSGIEPHDWEPSAADITGLEKADIFIYNGLNMEHWVFDVLNTLENKNLIIIEASKGTSLIEGNHDHHEDNHDNQEDKHEYDPHVWLNPMNAKIELENIKNSLILADPENKDYYVTNYEKYASELDILDKEYRDTLSPLPNRDVIVAHAAFGYLCEAYGLNQIAIEGLSSDSEPDPARMAEIINFATSQNIKVIFFEELVSPKIAETIADAIGAKTDILNPLEGLSKEQLAAGDDYFSIMRQNLEAIKAALE